MRPQAHIIMGKHACADIADGATPVVAREETPMPPHSPSQERSWLRSPGGLILLAFLAIAAFFLILEHRAHVVGILPYVLFLLCPVLHLLLHGRHGGTHTDHDTSRPQPPQGGA